MCPKLPPLTFPSSFRSTDIQYSLVYSPLTLPFKGHHRYFIASSSFLGNLFSWISNLLNFFSFSSLYHFNIKSLLQHSFTRFTHFSSQSRFKVSKSHPLKHTLLYNLHAVVTESFNLKWTNFFLFWGLRKWKSWKHKITVF
jgi:hypothetical protein